jgi:hypothetical protein
MTDRFEIDRFERKPHQHNGAAPTAAPPPVQPAPPDPASSVENDNSDRLGSPEALYLLRRVMRKIVRELSPEDAISIASAVMTAALKKSKETTP